MSFLQVHPLLVVSLTVLAFAGCLGSDTDADRDAPPLEGDGDDITSPSTNFTWAPSVTPDALALRLVFDLAGAQECKLALTASGGFSGEPGVHLHAYTEPDGDGAPGIRSTVWQGPSGEAHIQGQSTWETYDETIPFDIQPWSVDMGPIYMDPPPEEFAVNLFARGLQGGSGPPFALDLHCDQAFTPPAVYAGDEIVWFTSTHAKNATLAARWWPYAGAEVMVDGVVHAELASEVALRLIHVSGFSVQQDAPVATGTVTVEGPAGGEAWDVADIGWAATAYDGPPGDYRVEVDYVGAGPSVHGWLAAWGPYPDTASLDAAWTGDDASVTS